MTEKNPTPTFEDYLGNHLHPATRRRRSDRRPAFRAARGICAHRSPSPCADCCATAGSRQLLEEVDLTAAGVESAKAVIRRHMLTEWMLAKILKPARSKVHEEADKIEHSISNDVELSLID